MPVTMPMRYFIGKNYVAADSKRDMPPKYQAEGAKKKKKTNLLLQNTKLEKYQKPFFMIERK